MNIQENPNKEQTETRVHAGADRQKNKPLRFVI